MYLCIGCMGIDRHVLYPVALPVCILFSTSWQTVPVWQKYQKKMLPTCFKDMCKEHHKYVYRYIYIYIYISINNQIELYIYMVVDQNSFIPERPFFANKNFTFAKLSQTPCLSFAGPMLANNTSYEDSFVHHLPNYARESRITSW